MSSEFKGETCPVCKKNFDDCPHSLDQARNHKAKKAAERARKKEINDIVSKRLRSEEDKEKLRMHWHRVYRRLRHAYFAGDLPLPGEIQDYFDNNEFELAWDTMAESAQLYGVLGNLRKDFWKAMAQAAGLMDLPEKVKLAEAEAAKPWRCAVCEPLEGRGGVAGDGDDVCAGCMDAIRGLLKDREFADKQVYALLKQAFRHRDVLFEAKRLIEQANKDAGVGE